MSPPEVGKRPLATTRVLGLWLCLAFLSALAGIGGGLFAVPVLHYLVGLPMRVAIGTSLVLVFTLSIVATGAEALHPQSALDLHVVLLLLAGGYVGARLGFLAAQRLDTMLLKRMFVVVLVISMLRVLAVGSGGHGGPPSVQPTDWLQNLAVVLIGVGGGFIAPLLGVGGGLFVVPALFLGLPSIGYLEARACSIAMTVVTSAQSSILYLRAGQIEVAHARRFALTTAVGAILGVYAVHRPGWAELARLVMAGMLLFVAARFAWDTTRGLRARWLPSRSQD